MDWLKARGTERSTWVGVLQLLVCGGVFYLWKTGALTVPQITAQIKEFIELIAALGLALGTVRGTFNVIAPERKDE